MDPPVYAVCEQCTFLRAFGRSDNGIVAPERCPACGNEIRVHGRRERFPSAYVSRISRKLHRTPPV
jgi:predicted Zn-ribbon and HTH transcriptional regulator